MGSTISSPLTYVQEMHGTIPPAVYELVAVGGLNEFDALGVSVLEYNSNFKEGTFDSELDQSIAIPSKILLQTYKQTAPRFIEVIISQVHTQYIDLDSLSTPQVSGKVQCYQSTTAYNVTIPCHLVEGDPLLSLDYVTCPGDEGVLNYTCPYRATQPECIITDDEGASDVDACETIAASGDH